MGSMTQDLMRFAQGTRLGTAFSAAKVACALLGLASAGLLVRLAVPLSRDLLLSTVPGLCAAVRGYLVPPYIFVVVNFIIFVILKLPDTKNHHHQQQHSHKESPGGVAAAASTAPAADHPPKPPKDLPRSSPPAEISPNVWPDAASFASPPASSPIARESSPGAWSDESSLTTDFDGNSVTSSPAAASGVFAQSVSEIGVRAQGGEPPATGEDDDHDHDHDSLDATWKAITGGDPVRRRHLKKNETWSAPPRAHLEPAGGAPVLRREMRKSETFRQPPSPSPSPTTRRLVVERRVNRRGEVSTADDADDINQQFEAFIKKNKDQMRLQREESAAQRYMEMVNSPGY